MIYLLGFFFAQLAFGDIVPSPCQSFGKFIPIGDKFSSVEYMRVHPSGNYVMYSTGMFGQPGVHIADLTKVEPGSGKIVPRVIPTRLYNEAYPCEGSWTLISSCREKEGMGYYRFSEILLKNGKPSPVFHDNEHDQFYQSCAELTGSTPNHQKFRMLLYGKSSRTYEVITDSSGQAKVTYGKKYDICSNLEQDLSQPILSKDGSEVAISLDGSQRVFRINDRDGTCTEVETLGYEAGKVNFSYQAKNSLGMLAFSTSSSIAVSGAVKPSEATGNQVYIFDRDTKKTYRISQPWLEESSYYPGFTKDGKLIYVSTRNEQRGIVIVDIKSTIAKLQRIGSEDVDSLCTAKKAKSDESPSKGNPADR